MRSIHYDNRNCEKCNRSYTPASSNQTWCPSCLEKPCAVCGKTIHVRNRSKFDQTKYCSNECRRKGWANDHKGEKAIRYTNGNRSEKETVFCSVCGAAIERLKGQARKWSVHLCSNKCRGIYQSQFRSGVNSPKYSKVSVVCEWCGKEFLTWPCIKEDVRFCSMQCRNDWQSDMMQGSKHYNWNGGSAEARTCAMVHREYKAWRQQVFERDSYTCRICGDSRGGNLNAHHIKPYRDYPELRLDITNGITLCSTCHIAVHNGMKDIQSDPCR